MLIRPLWIESRDALAHALENPAVQEDGVLYATSRAALAEALLQRKLPCIFVERTGGTRDGGENPRVYGVDLVICEDAREEQTDGWQEDQTLLRRVWERHYGLPWTIARTARLLIRESVPKDWPQILSFYKEESGNPDVEPLGEAPREAFCAYIQNRYPFYGYGLWSVVLRQSGQVIGRLGLEERRMAEVAGGDEEGTAAELSYLIRRDCRRRGYAREAARAVLAYAGRELGFRQIYLRTSPGNLASRRLARSLGFCEDGRAENFFRLDLTEG